MGAGSTAVTRNQPVMFPQPSEVFRGHHCSRFDLYPNHRRADALGLLAERFQVVIHVDAQAMVAGSEAGSGILAEGGIGVSAETSRRLACDRAEMAMRILKPPSDGPGGFFKPVVRRQHLQIGDLPTVQVIGCEVEGIEGP